MLCTGVYNSVHDSESSQCTGYFCVIGQLCISLIQLFPSFEFNFARIRFVVFLLTLVFVLPVLASFFFNPGELVEVSS